MKFLKENKLEIILITSIVFLVLSPALFNYFRADDWTWLYVAHASERDVSQIFTLQLAGFFRPFNHLLFLFWYMLFGLNPVGYNAVNITLHATNSLLVYVLAWKFTKNRYVSLVSALVFATLAVHFESVFFISGGMSDNSLLGFFSLTSLLLFMRWQETKKTHYIALSLMVFAFNLLSYEGSITFIPLLFFYLFAFSKFNLKSILSSIKTTLPYITISIPYLAYQYTIQVSGTVAKIGLFSIGWHFLRNLLDYSVSMFTIFPLIGPEYLARLNAPQIVYQIVNYAILATAAAVILVAAYILIRGSRTSKFFLGWYIIVILPFLFFTSHITSRYTYTPSIGIAVLVSMLSLDAYKKLAKFGKNAKPIVLGAVTILILFNIVALALIENYKYKINDDQTMASFLQSAHPQFPQGSKIYFVNDTIPFKSPVLQMVMSVLYPQGSVTSHQISADNLTYNVFYSSNFTVYEINRNQTTNIIRGENVYIFDYIKTDYRTGKGVEIN